jgi:predicted PurR-regulated permease PerM
MTFLVAIKAIENNENIFLVFLSAFAVMAIVQIIQDTLLVPKIMGKTTGLNPAVILLSLSIWGALLGVVGMIIALPITTLLISYYKRYILWERVEKKKRSIKKDTIQTEQENLKS